MKRRQFFRSNAILLACGLACVAAFSGCSRFQQTAAQASASASAPAASEPSSAAPSTSASLELAYDKPAVVGASVHATATGLPPGKSVELTWGTVQGGWVVEDYYHFRGKKYTETTSKLGEFSSDSSGRLDAQLHDSRGLRRRARSDRARSTARPWRRTASTSRRASSSRQRPARWERRSSCKSKAWAGAPWKAPGW